MIEVTHNPETLPFRRTYRVTNSVQAYFYVQRLMMTRRERGLRVRYSHDVPNKLHLEARNAIAIDTVESLIKPFKPKRIAWSLQ